MELSSNLDIVSAILQICLIDLLLSGDNAIVIAMACAQLPAAIRPRAVLLGTGAAVLFRVVLTFLATLMLRAPYLKIVGAGLLLLIAIELMAGESASGRSAARSAADGGIWRAVALIVVADAVMSLDNVVAVAAAAQDNLLYLLLGLLISVPILVFSSLFVTRLLDRYPLIIDGGAALLGWIAGKIAVSDPAFGDVLQAQSFGLVAMAPLLGALYVLIQGRRLRRERAAPAGTGAPVATMPVTAATLTAVPVTAVPVAPIPVTEIAVTEIPVTNTPAAAVPSAPPGQPALPLAIPELDLPRRLSRMDLTILAGVAVPLVGLIGMIVYFVIHAATSR